MKLKRSFLVFIFLIFVAEPFVYAKLSFNLGKFQQQIERLQKRLNGGEQEGWQESNEKGVIAVWNVSKPWFFKMKWYNASACTRIYYQINDQQPVFLVEYVGLYPAVSAPIQIKGLHRGDTIRFLIKTHWNGKWYGPAYSNNRDFFMVRRLSSHAWDFRFEDVASFDRAYNDGEFYFYQEGEGVEPNRFINIKKFDVKKIQGGVRFEGEIHVSQAGRVRSIINIKDNHWRVYKKIDISFTPREAGDYRFTYDFKDPLRAPMYTSIWKVWFKGERDARVRALKGCFGKEETINEALNEPNQAENSVFGSAEGSPFVFVGNVYFIRRGTSHLPNFKALTPVGKIYTAVLNIKPRRFSEGFPGITNRFEWFAIDYKSQIYIPRSRRYKFALLSDDGSRLIIDGRVVIDNDGIHPPREKSGSIYLKSGVHTIEVQYFQGPRYYVALVLYIYKNGRKVPFDVREFAPVKVNDMGCKIRLTMNSAILFDFNSYSLKPEALKVLDSIYRYLSNVEYKKIEVVGYTDNVGSKQYNLVLSRRRAMSVADYLIARGIPEDFVEIKGMGEENPRYPNDTEQHRALNRRVEITVILCNSPNKPSSMNEKELEGVVEVYRDDVYIVVNPECKCRRSYKVLGRYRDVIRELKGETIRVRGRIKKFSPWSGEIYVDDIL